MIKIELTGDDVFVIRVALREYHNTCLNLVDILSKDNSDYLKYILQDIDVINKLLNDTLNFWKDFETGDEND